MSVAVAVPRPVPAARREAERPLRRRRCGGSYASISRVKGRREVYCICELLSRQPSRLLRLLVAAETAETAEQSEEIWGNCTRIQGCCVVPINLCSRLLCGLCGPCGDKQPERSYGTASRTRLFPKASMSNATARCFPETAPRTTARAS